jgi:hypothetical protein
MFTFLMFAGLATGVVIGIRRKFSHPSTTRRVA